MRLSRSWQLTVLLALASAAVALAQGGDGGAQLRDAASKGDLAQVRALLDAGTDANAASEYGATALTFACDKGHVEVVRLLLERGADPNAKDTFYGSTPADWAGSKGHGEILKLLAEAGADVTGAVAAAVGSGKPEGLRPLLDAKMLDARQLTIALTAAKAEGQAEMAALLEAAGAQPLPPADAKVDPALLAAYAGEYEREGMRVVLSVSPQQALLVAFGQGQPMELLAESDTRFRLKEYEVVSLTVESEGGAVRRVHVDQAGSARTFERIAPAAEAPAPQRQEEP